ncbi:hypothetical protein ACJZ2D_016881 [Fusarium nematophilum]
MSNVTLDFSTFHSIIGGRLEGTNKTRHNLNPSTPEANPEVPLSTRDDVDRAVKAAQETAATWANVPVADRQQAVIHFADALERLQDDFATVLVKEQGKPVRRPLALGPCRDGIESGRVSNGSVGAFRERQDSTRHGRASLP